MYDEDVYKIVFRIYYRYCEYFVMLFGLTIVLSTFQSFMNDVFRNFLRQFVLVFIYDILIYRKIWEDYLFHVKYVLIIIQQQCFYVKWSKCIFVVLQLEYLGYVILRDGVVTKFFKVVVV